MNRRMMNRRVVPVAHIDLNVAETEIGLVDASADDDPPADRQIEILTVEPDGAGAVGEPIFLTADRARDVPDDGHVAVVDVDVVARGHDPRNGRHMVGPGQGGKRRKSAKRQEEAEGFLHPRMFARIPRRFQVDWLKWKRCNQIGTHK